MVIFLQLALRRRVPVVGPFLPGYCRPCRSNDSARERQSTWMHYQCSAPNSALSTPHQRAPAICRTPGTQLQRHPKRLCADYNVSCTPDRLNASPAAVPRTDSLHITSAAAFSPMPIRPDISSALSSAYRDTALHHPLRRKTQAAGFDNTIHRNGMMRVPRRMIIMHERACW